MARRSCSIVDLLEENSDCLFASGSFGAGTKGCWTGIGCFCRGVGFRFGLGCGSLVFGAGFIGLK